MGIEGIEGINPLTDCRGTPGLEGYPGVVLQRVSKIDTENFETYGSPGAKLKN
jgi:hypothetical protein